jgi:hypothetical protein
MTASDAEKEILFLLPENTGQLVKPLIGEWLLATAEKVSSDTGAYRNLLTVTSTASQDYVDLANSGTYDLIFPLWVTYDGLEIFVEESRHVLIDRVRRLGTPSNGVPASCAVDDPNNPTKLYFNVPCSEAKTVQVYYARKTAAFTDLPAIWQRDALPFAKARACEYAAARNAEKPQLFQGFMALASKFDSQFSEWVNKKARTLKFQHLEVDRMRVRVGWLTG